MQTIIYRLTVGHGHSSWKPLITMLLLKSDRQLPTWKSNMFWSHGGVTNLAAIPGEKNTEPAWEKVSYPDFLSKHNLKS